MTNTGQNMGTEQSMGEAAPLSTPANTPGGIAPSTATPAHQAAAPGRARVAVMTISDTRTPDTDESGNYLRRMVAEQGHEVAEYLIVHDDAVEIRSALVRLLREVDLILTTGGTGIAGRDVTIGVVESLLVKTIPGFGELFRTLSYQQVGGAAMLSRATGGLTRGSLLFALPGSLNAVQTAWEGILKDQIGHLVFEVARQGQPGQSPQAHLPKPEATLPQVVQPGGAAGVPLADVTVIGAAPQITPGNTDPLHPPHVNQGAAAGIGRHAGVAASPSTVNSVGATGTSELERSIGRHAVGRTDKEG